MVQDLSIKDEILRKSIHLLTGLFPIIYASFLTKDQAIIVSGIILIVFITGEILRTNVIKIKQIYEGFFGKILRNHELQSRFNGATLLFLAFFLTCFVFDKDVAIVSMLLLSFSDSLAAVFGKKFGKIKLFNKSLEGTLTFFIITAMIFSIFFENYYMIIGVAALCAVLELIPLPINDNLSIPLLSGTILTLLK
ncbi:MAG: hypothetical protein H6627_01755 [Calditrichae bacterium]|nr:hypothetical protein [Calditrichia bacterium]